MQLCARTKRMGIVSSKRNVEKDMKLSSVLNNTNVHLNNVLLCTPKNENTFLKKGFAGLEKIAFTDMTKTPTII